MLALISVRGKNIGFPKPQQMSDAAMDDAESSSSARTDALGAYLKSVRLGIPMTLREVEDATGRQISNAYLSQLETGKITKPSPHILHSLAGVYNISYGDLMRRAGYILPSTSSDPEKKHGKAATFAVENLSAEEEAELLKYLAWIRSQRGGREKT